MPTLNHLLTPITPGELTHDEKQAVISLALSILKNRHRRSAKFNNPNDTRNYLCLKYGQEKNEIFGALFLDNRHRLIEKTELFYGTIDGASVHPRVVVQKALEINAAVCILFHNHPSGVSEPSHADEIITQRLREALNLIDVRVLDHYIVAGGESMSFAERGLL